MRSLPERNELGELLGFQATRLSGENQVHHCLAASDGETERQREETSRADLERAKAY